MEDWQKQAIYSYMSVHSSQNCNSQSLAKLCLHAIAERQKNCTLRLYPETLNISADRVTAFMYEVAENCCEAEPYP